MIRGIGRVVLAIFLTLMVSGCKSDTSVTVIKGPGISNNSKMIGFNDLCEGTVEGFIEDSLLISRIEGNKINFYSVDYSSRKPESILQLVWYKDFEVLISRDKMFFLYGNKLVDIRNKTFITLPYSEIKGTSQLIDYKSIKRYAFYGDHELIYSNPIYYIQKYISNNLLSSNMLFLNQYGMDVVRTKDDSRNDDSTNGDTNNKRNFDFSNIDMPDFSSFESPILDIDNMKYFFVGHDREKNKNCCYILDLFEKKIRMIDTDVKSISLSPDFSKLAYIKENSRKKNEDSIIVADSSGNQKSVIKEVNVIKALAWSEDSSWIAFSAGETEKVDIYVVKSDGTNEEQLTQGMNAQGRISWSHNGDKIAFGISDSEKNNNRVYIIKLGIKPQERFEIKNEVNSKKRENASLLLQIIRRDTDEIIKSYSTKN